MFDNILGQEQVKNIFRRTIEEKRLVHSYLFTGMSGVGKFLFARELTKTLLCENHNGCGKCRPCRLVEHNNHPSLYLIQPPPGKKHIPIGEANDPGTIRAMEYEINLKPFEGRYRIFIINEAGTLSQEAANALLKTLEEPPAHSFIILVTAKPNVLPTTIRSRCQVIRFHPLPGPVMEQLLSRTGNLSGLELKIITVLSDGSIGEALSLIQKGYLQQRQKLLDLLVRKNQPSILSDEIINFARQSKENEKIRQGIIQQFKTLGLFLRDLMLINLNIDEPRVLLNQDKIDTLNQNRRFFPVKRIQKSLESIIQAEQYLRMNLNMKLVVANTVAQL